MGRSPAYVRGMFTAIAPRYDFLNHLLSLNVDRSWRRAAVARLDWEAKPDGTYLDLCAGTLDLAAELARRDGFRGRVIGADFAVPMLTRGRNKAPRTVPVAADALELPFPARSEEHTSELQSHVNLVCRLLLEKKKKNKISFKHVVKNKI